MFFRLWRVYWVPCSMRVAPRGSCSCTTMPQLTGHLQPEETGLPGLPLSWSPTLFSGSGPVGLPPVPWSEKQLKCRHFSSDALVIAAAETWLDGQHSDFFLSGLQKLEQRAKSVVSFVGSVLNKSLSGRAKDLYASLVYFFLSLPRFLEELSRTVLDNYLITN
jgi:hypothetical protein